MSGRRLPDWLSAHLEYTKNSESPTAFHEWAGASCIAAALQRRVYMKWGHSTIYPNNYIILVGPSGKARKAEPIMIARDFLRELNLPLIGEDNSQEAVILDMKQSMTTYTDETTGKLVFQCATTCLAEELAVFTGYQNTTFLAYLTNWYDSPDKWTRRTKHQGTDEIMGMCFNMIAATAPDWLPHILTREAIGGGFTSRCIFIVQQERSKIVSNPNLTPPDEKLREDLLHDLEIITTLTGEFKFDEGGLHEYEEWYIRESQREADGSHVLPDPIFDGYRSRRATHVKKLAMALSASEGMTRIVTASHFRRALALMEGAEENMPRVFGGVGPARYAQETQLVSDFIKVHGNAKKSELLRALYRSVDDTSLTEIIKVLEGMKKIRSVRLMEEKDWLYEWMD